jgi:hypothetical protein
MTENDDPSRTFASLIIIGKELDPVEITELLGIKPSKSFKRGDQRTDTEKWPHGYWELCSSESIKSSDLELHLQWIVDQLTPDNEYLLALRKEKGLKAKISCFSILGKGQTVINLPLPLLKQLADTNLSIELDLYSD